MNDNSYGLYGYKGQDLEPFAKLQEWDVSFLMLWKSDEGGYSMLWDDDYHPEFFEGFLEETGHKVLERKQESVWVQVRFDKAFKIGDTVKDRTGDEGVIISLDETGATIERVRHPIRLVHRKFSLLTRIDEPQPEPPAPAAFAVGSRVQNIEGDMTGTVVSVDNEGFEVLFDGRTKPNPFRLGTKFVEPLPSDPGAPALSQDVLDLSPDEYKAYSMSKKIAIHERQFSKKEGFTPPYIIDALLSKGLIEAIGTGRETTYRAVIVAPTVTAPALPAGVTRDASEGVVDYDVHIREDYTCKMRWGVDSGDMTIDLTDVMLFLSVPQFKRIIAAGQALIAEMEANNGDA